DLLGGHSAALGEHPDFGRDNGKTSSLLACPCSFDSGVQGEDVGLKSDAVNHADDVDDLARRGIDGAHGAHHPGNHVAAAHSHAGGGHGQLVGLAGVVCVLLDGAG